LTNTTVFNLSKSRPLNFDSSYSLPLSIFVFRSVLFHLW